MSAFRWSHKVGKTRRRTRLERAKGQARRKRSAQRRAYDHPYCSFDAKTNDNKHSKCEPFRAHIRPKRAGKQASV